MKTSRDAVFSGALTIVQPARGDGYRVNVDALLLAHFAAQGRARRPPARLAMDLGAGVGAVGLALLHLGAAERVILVEADSPLAALAARNVTENRRDGVASVREGDALAAATAEKGRADLVVCNPPYLAPGRGNAPAPALVAARVGELERFVRAARTACGRNARACFVYPAQELATLFSTLRAAGLEPKRLRAVHPKAGATARVALVDAAPGRAGGLAIEPPLFEHGDDTHTVEIRALLAGATRAPLTRSGRAADRG